MNDITLAFFLSFLTQRGREKVAASLSGTTFDEASVRPLQNPTHITVAAFGVESRMRTFRSFCHANYNSIADWGAVVRFLIGTEQVSN